MGAASHSTAVVQPRHRSHSRSRRTTGKTKPRRGFESMGPAGVPPATGIDMTGGGGVPLLPPLSPIVTKRHDTRHKKPRGASRHFRNCRLPTMALCICRDMSRFTSAPPPPDPHPPNGTRILSIPAPQYTHTWGPNGPWPAQWSGAGSTGGQLLAVASGQQECRGAWWPVQCPRAGVGAGVRHDPPELVCVSTGGFWEAASSPISL